MMTLAHAPTGPSRTTGRVDGAGSAVLVWLIWAATLASILASIARDGRNIPFEEDWLMVAPMTGHEPDIPRWLWSQNSEHRLPLPRLVNLTLLRATRDFRSTMVFDTLALGAVAAAMILVARALRGGQTSLADAFFPLLLLQLGNWDNLVWGWQIQFVLPTVLACALLLIIVARPAPPTGGILLGGAIALIGLPLSGANGLIFTPVLAGWFAYAAWVRRRASGKDQETGLWLPAGAALVAGLLCVVYFIGYDPSPWNEPSPGLGATLATSGKFLALSVGPAAVKSWVLFGAVVSGVLVSSVIALVRAWRPRGDERLRIAGLLAFLAAIGVLALAVGWGRAGHVVATGRMPTRYVLLAAPGLCAAYFSLLLYGEGWLRRAGPAGLALLLALLFPLNTRIGFQRRAWFGEGMAAFEQDLAAGASPELLAQRHHSFMLHWDEALMVASMKMLRDARIGPFVNLGAKVSGS
jgi:hypothetical protein